MDESNQFGMTNSSPASSPLGSAPSPLSVGHHPQMPNPSVVRDRFARPPREAYKTEEDDDTFAVPVKVSAPMRPAIPEPTHHEENKIEVAVHPQQHHQRSMPMPMNNFVPRHVPVAQEPYEHEHESPKHEHRPHNFPEHPAPQPKFHRPEPMHSHYYEESPSKGPMIFVLFLVLFFGIYLLLDAGIISNNLNLPFHIFK